jgi:hypothetical protein
MRGIERGRADGRGSAEARRKYAEARAAGYGHEAAARSAGMVVDSPESITIQ